MDALPLTPSSLSRTVPYVTTLVLRTISTLTILALLLSAMPTAHADPRATSASTSRGLDVGSLSAATGSALSTTVALLHELYERTRQGARDGWQVFPMVGIVICILSSWWVVKKTRFNDETSENNGKHVRDKSDGEGSGWLSMLPFQRKRASDPASKSEPGLLQKHSEYRAFTLPRLAFTYPNLRVFYRPHPQADKLPSKPASLPLLVFVHGLGGSIAQFHPLLTSLVNLAPCLAIDLPGCGQSAFAPTAWEAYTTEALVELLSVVIDSYRDHETGQECVLIGHSMGCSLAASIASRTSPRPTSLVRHTLGLVAICPPASEFSETQVRWIRRALYVPNVAAGLWRKWDQRGGVDSKSLTRFVGTKADLDTRKLQMRFNRQSRTAVTRRMVGGFLPGFDGPGMERGGFRGEEVWAGLDIPIFLVAGEDDGLTPPKELEKILGYLRKPGSESTAASKQLGENGHVAKPSHGSGDATGVGHESPSRNLEQQAPARSDGRTRKALKTTVLPSPAAHALLYAPVTSRTLAGLISDFLAVHIDRRLSLGWQLQYLSTEGKWDVKNLAKWQAVAPVSRPIGGIFRAMKTLREVDDRHCPEIFVSEWGGRIKSVIDISHESPVYDPRGLEKGGIGYHKFPTASKIPPTAEEVRTFVELVDRLLSAAAAAADDSKDADSPAAPSASIGVHCHYGFNRTGFFIVCYLVERRGYRLTDALEEFARQRAPGIRHEHFIDTLFVRYCVGLKRAPTL